MATIKTFGEFEVTPDTTRDDLDATLVDEIKNALENAYDSDIFDLLNEWRENNHYDTLREMCEDELNDALDGYSAWDVLQLDIDTTDDYFTFNGYGDISTTCDVWHDCDAETVAEWIAENEDAHGISELQDILDDYSDALEALEEMEDENEASAEDAKRAELINKIVDETLAKAIVFSGGTSTRLVTDEITRLKLAVIELFNAVQGDG